MAKGTVDRGLVAAAAAIAVFFGLVIISGLILLSSRPTPDNNYNAATFEYGQRLIRETALFLGPDHRNPAMRYAGNRLACASCHLGNGTIPGTLSLLPTSPRYPRESFRDGGMRDIRDRINGCMERSMNGRRMPRDSVEMVAMEVYLNELNTAYINMSAEQKAPDEPPAFAEPDRTADVEAGRIVYQEKCQTCHGWNGFGLRASSNPADGYVFPPLWGGDSFNNGAGMNRVLTAARFIKARMPFGDPDLSDDQAYDVAAYINSNPRPQLSNLEVDYPDRTRKPIDSPYPPYADDFPREQHRFGPFGPIRAFYARQRESEDSAR